MIDPSGPSVKVDRAQIKRYLGLIFPPEFGWRGMISASHSLPNGTGMPSGRWSYDAAVDGIAELAESGSRRGAAGTYLRCSTVRRNLSAGARGKVADSLELPGLWADLDIAGPGHRHDPEKFGGLVLPATAEEAAGIVTMAMLPAPTAWVHSGGGLYAWWLFGEHVEVSGDPGYWSQVSEAWQAKLREGAALSGYHYGPVGNLDRVLGMVGTMNAKPGTQPAMRVILSDNGPRYAPGELAGLVMTEAPTTGVGASDVGRGHAAKAAGELHGPLPASMVHEVGHVSPLDDFETRHSWAQILVPKGWALVKGDAELGGYCEWRHADATHPLSATTGKDPARDRMWNFSSSCGLPTEEPMTKGYVYAALWHGGDMSTAARAVQAIGYGPQGSSGTRAAGGPLLGAGNPSTERHLELIAASGMGGPCASRWMWEEDDAQWLPLGGLCLLGGREGLGKTTWTYRIIAALTAGTLPGDLLGTPRSAVIAATEDDWRATIIPRLMAAGADLERVYRIDAIEPDRVTGVSLPDDLAALGALLASAGEIALLVLDPIITVLSAKLDSHKDHEVRKALEPVSALAHGLGITVLGLIHDNKSSGTDLSTRLMGSRAFVAVARAALVCAEERDDPEEGQADAFGADPVTPDRRAAPVKASAAGPVRTFLLGQVKSNLGAKVPWSIRYQINAALVGRDEALGKDIHGSHIVRVGRQTAGLEDIVRASERGGDDVRSGPRRAAEACLLDLLSGGEKASREIKDAAVNAGHSPTTVDRAARDLATRGRVIMVMKGRLSYWSVPSTSEQSSEVSGVYGVRDVRDVRDVGQSHVTSGKGEPTSPTSPTSHVTSPETDARLTQVCLCPGDLHAPWCKGAGAGAA
jgi:hypothetical protein